MTWGHGSPETVAVLLQMGCDKDGVMHHRNTLMKVFVRAVELKHHVAQSALTTLIYHSTNATPLMRSILSGSYPCAHLLLENKAGVDLRNSKNQILGGEIRCKTCFTVLVTCCYCCMFLFTASHLLVTSTCPQARICNSFNVALIMMFADVNVGVWAFKHVDIWCSRIIVHRES